MEPNNARGEDDLSISEPVEDLSISETVFTNNTDSDCLTDNDINFDLNEHGMSDAAADIFREFVQDGSGGDETQEGSVAGGGGGGGVAGGDVHSLLAQKEKDLILTAELGKALLEENEELTRKQEIIAKEHADIIEALEQEKHELRRRLEISEGIYENKLVDLQTELRAVRKELANQNASSRLADKDKQDSIEELMEQNHRLNTQLAQVSETKEDLSNKLHHLQKQQPRGRRKSSSVNDHRAHLDDLQDELRLLSSKSRELERRVYSLSEEREALLCNLKESNDRVMMLEKHSMDVQQQLDERGGELIKVRQMHNSALEELEELRFQASLISNSTNHNNNNSLFFELEESQMQPLGVEMLSSPGAFSMDYEEGGEGGDNKTGRDGNWTIEEDDVFEVETDKLLKDDYGGNGGGDAIKEHKYHKVLEEVYFVLADILWDLQTFSKKPPKNGSSNSSSGLHGNSSSRRRRRSNSGGSRSAMRRQSEESPRPSSRSEEVRTQLKEVKTLLQGILKPQQSQSLSSPSRRRLSLDDHTQIYSLESHIETLRGELCGTQTHIELLQAELDNQDECMRKKDEQLTKLHAKTSPSHIGPLQRQLHALQDELLESGYSPHDLRDGILETKQKDEPRSQIARVEPVRQEAALPARTLAANSIMESPRDELIRRLQKERDEAIAKRNSAEMELTDARLDMMNLDGQLLEAIHQKLELSQELDQWQVDIHELLDDRLRQQLRKQELERRKARAATGSGGSSPSSSSQKPNKTKLAALQKKFPFLNLKLTEK